MSSEEKSELTQMSYAIGQWEKDRVTLLLREGKRYIASHDKRFKN